MVGGGFGGCTINLLKKNGVEGFQTYIARKYREKWGRELRMWEVKITNGVEMMNDE